MPSYRFSWDAFDDRTIAALASAQGHEGDAASARSWLSSKIKRPTPEFVRTTKRALVSTWLPNYPGAEQIVDRLIDAGLGPMKQPKSQAGYVHYIAESRNSRRLRQFLLEALLRFGDMDKDPSEEERGPDFTRRFAVLSTKDQPADLRKPHGYQEEAWDRLSAHLAEAQSTGRFQGLLVMPTGSGKTYTAIRWLMRNVVAKGRRVVWLAHRHELLSQAAAEFHRLAGHAAPRERLRVRTVSGSHCATSQIDPADDIVVASVHSLARRPDIAAQVVADDRVFLVIDEAHHAPAKSYQDILKALQAKKSWSVLGLTATPTRTVEDERAVLAELFGRRILAQVEISKLIEQGILARPIPVVIKTEADVERGVTQEDIEHFFQFHEASEEWLDRIAGLVDRNRVIVDHYLAEREKYGPTLIFAINVGHAALLTEALARKGVRAAYVASYRPDGSDGDPGAVIQQFRQGDLDVLVNVQMVTEGVDLPRIQTVFLTRPTQSEILMRQMIGRALRGPAAGGSKEAYLVSFEDHWSKFDIASPFALVPDVVPPPGPPKDGSTSEPPPAPIEQLAEHLPWGVIQGMVELLKGGADYTAHPFEAVPHGWFVLERDHEDEGIRSAIAIYEHQSPSWNALLAHLRRLGAAGLAAASVESLYAEFFADCEPPAPSFYQVGQVVEHFRAGGAPPEYQDVKGRSVCDPDAVAKQVFDGDLGPKARTALVDKAYTSLAKAIYPLRRDYERAIDSALYELQHPGESTREVRGVPIFDPRPEEQLAPGPARDLRRLMSEVLERGAALLGVERLEYRGTLTWSNRPIKGWFGKAWPDLPVPMIKINRLLDSPSFSEETLRFLLWHEFLHVHLRQGHSPTFREHERRWPGFIAADREMDTLNERFGVQYW